MYRTVLLKAAAAMTVLIGGTLQAGTGGLRYDESLIPRFNIPKMSQAPTIDGTINAAEWQSATKVMGMVSTGGLEHKDRPVSFWLAWDKQHLYLAYRVDILTEPVPHLKRAYREKYATSVVFDDALEVGLFMHDRNKAENEVSSYLKFVLNSVGAGEYMKNYPEIGQVMFNWTPDFDIGNRTYTDDNCKFWWEMELAMDLEDLQMRVEHQAGDRVDIGLFADVKNPGWQWLDYPSASGHLEHYGFPRTVLTEGAPYIQIEDISGLHDEKINLKSVIQNPSDKPVKVNASLLLQHAAKIASGQAGQLDAPTTVVDEKRALTIPANGSTRFDVTEEFPGLPSAGKGKGFLQLAVIPADNADAPPVYTFATNFWGTDKSYLKPSKYEPYLATKIAFNPANGKLAVGADTMDAPIPEGAEVAGATYRVTLGGKEIKSGNLQYFVNQWYDDLIELGELAPGKYTVELALVDAAGKELAAATSKFEKKNEAEEFAKWWNNDIGNTETLLEPFEPLEVKRSLLGGKTSIACTRRVYEFGSLGLPRQIQANGGPVLAGPARVVLTVDGKEYSVPTDKKMKVTGKQDWRVDFECRPVSVAGVAFSATGWMEQDGLVEIELTYAPALEPAGPAVEIDELRIEWPIAQSTPDIYMACMGQGGNYSARTIGEVPQGQGEVWDTRDDIGITGSGRRVGNFVGNLWVGNEQRGLFWCADSDRGWEPDERVAAHALVKDEGGGMKDEGGGMKDEGGGMKEEGGRMKGEVEPRTVNTEHPGTVLIVNNLIGSAEGKAPFRLTEPRTVRFGYNASPFRHLAPGFRLNQRSAAGSFSGGKYKVNWDTGQDFFTVLSPPFSDTERWPEYYAYCKEKAEKLTYGGGTWNGGQQQVVDSPGNSAYYNGNNRQLFYNSNQIALRGYGYKSIERPNPYSTFKGDWLDSRNRETLSKTYRDYTIWLMDRQVKEGGCQHFYFDISFGEYLHRDLAAGFGYRLPDGGIQPESSDTNLREWYKRVQAMMQENDLYPGGVSGHATHSFSLKMLPFTDAILDSEYPMADSIDVYPSDAMIALSCPHTFGTNVQHLGNFMNPTWPAMHDAVGGNYRGPLLAYDEFKAWGMGRTDVEFIPYWRNDHVLKEITPGLIASMWKRDGSAIIAVMNYGPDERGQGKTRSGNFTLDLEALGVPADAIKAGGERLRIRQFYNSSVQMYFLKELDWAKKHGSKALPPITPKLDLATGAVSGFDINYHDVKFLAIDWEDEPVDDAGWQHLAEGEAARTRLLEWGITDANKLPDAEATKMVSVDNPAIEVEAWKRAGDNAGRGNSVLLRVGNTGEQETEGTLKLDLAGLGVNIRQVWSDFTSAVSLDGRPVENRESADQKQHSNIVYNAYDGELYYSLGKGRSRVFSIDRH